MVYGTFSSHSTTTQWLYMYLTIKLIRHSLIGWWIFHNDVTFLLFDFVYFTNLSVKKIEPKSIVFDSFSHKMASQLSVSCPDGHIDAFYRFLSHNTEKILVLIRRECIIVYTLRQAVRLYSVTDEKWRHSTVLAYFLVAVFRWANLRPFDTF